MRRTSLVCFALLVTVALTGICFARGESASKSAVAVKDFSIMSSRAVGVSADGWNTILSTGLKTSEQKDLIVEPLLECGLYTSTKVSRKQGTSDTSSATASVKVRVLMDGVAAAPEEVVYCKRSQELTAVFQGIFNECSDKNFDGVIDPATECTFDPEQLQLLLDTMSANSFNFALGNVGSGYHTIDVQAKLESSTSVQTGAADAYATIGRGSVTVEEVRLAQDIVIP